MTTAASKTDLASTIRAAIDASTAGGKFAMQTLDGIRSAAESARETAQKLDDFFTALLQSQSQSPQKTGFSRESLNMLHSAFLEETDIRASVVNLWQDIIGLKSDVMQHLQPGGDPAWYWNGDVSTAGSVLAEKARKICTSLGVEAAPVDDTLANKLFADQLRADEGDTVVENRYVMEPMTMSEIAGTAHRRNMQAEAAQEAAEELEAQMQVDTDSASDASGSEGGQ